MSVRVPDERLDELAKLAEDATPGPWFAHYSGVFSAPVSREYDRLEQAIPLDAPDEAYDHLPESMVARVPAAAGDTPTRQGARDGEFIAAAGTDLAALVADLRDERADNQRLREALREIAGHVAVDECEPDYCHWRRTLTLAGTALAALAEEPRA